MDSSIVHCVIHTVSTKVYTEHQQQYTHSINYSTHIVHCKVPANPRLCCKVIAKYWPERVVKYQQCIDARTWQRKVLFTGRTVQCCPILSAQLCKTAPMHSKKSSVAVHHVVHTIAVHARRAQSHCFDAV